MSATAIAKSGSSGVGFGTFANATFCSIKVNKRNNLVMVVGTSFNLDTFSHSSIVLNYWNNSNLLWEG